MEVFAIKSKILARLKLPTYQLLVDISRCQKVAGTMQALLGGEEIYHYHTKVRGLKGLVLYKHCL